MILDANGMPVLQPLVDDASTATFNTAFAAVGTAFAGMNGVVTNIAALDAVTGASPGARYFMTAPGTGIERMVWVAWQGAGVTIDWHIVETVRADTKAHLDSFVAAVAGSGTDLTFVVGANAYVSGTSTFYRFTSTAGAMTLVPSSGLRAIIPTSVAGTGVTVSAGGVVSYTAATTVRVNGCFTSEFENYLVLYNVSARSAAVDASWRMRVGGADDTGSNYSYVRGFDAGTSRTVASSATATSALVDIGGGRSSSVLNVFSPALAVPTRLTGTSTGSSTIASIGFEHSLSTAYDGFTIFPASGNFGGTICVYGYDES